MLFLLKKKQIKHICLWIKRTRVLLSEKDENRAHVCVCISLWIRRNFLFPLSKKKKIKHLLAFFLEKNTHAAWTRNSHSPDKIKRRKNTFEYPRWRQVGIPVEILFIEMDWCHTGPVLSRSMFSHLRISLEECKNLNNKGGGGSGEWWEWATRQHSSSETTKNCNS